MLARMKTFTLDSSIWLQRPIEEVFAFFADAHNLAAITPPWMHFRTVTPGPIVMAAGTRFEHRLRVKGFRFAGKAKLRRGSRRGVLSTSSGAGRTDFGFTSTGLPRATGERTLSITSLMRCRAGQR